MLRLLSKDESLLPFFSTLEKGESLRVLTVEFTLLQFLPLSMMSFDLNNCISYAVILLQLLTLRIMSAGSASR